MDMGLIFNGEMFQAADSISSDQQQAMGVCWPQVLISS